jgi:mannan endo-1,6-alpha-mannosidase
MSISQIHAPSKQRQQYTKEMLQYNTGEIPGILPSPYTWSDSGAVFGSLVDYWYLTGDSQWNNITLNALLTQAGEHYDFRPGSMATSESSSDRLLWGLAVMSAAEYGFPSPPTDDPSWISMAKAVFDGQAWSWNQSFCGGGLDLVPLEASWNSTSVKDNLLNARFFSLASRLFSYTGNGTYLSWAELSLGGLKALGSYPRIIISTTRAK